MGGICWEAQNLAKLDWATLNRLLVWGALGWMGWGLGLFEQGWEFHIVFKMILYDFGGFHEEVM